MNHSLTDLLKKVHIEYGEDIRPVRDWLALLGLLAVLLLASVAWNVWTYYDVASGGTFGGTNTTAPAINTDSFSAAQAVFGARATEEGNYRSVYHFVDPSK
jgi:hypothetical protein